MDRARRASIVAALGSACALGWTQAVAAPPSGARAAGLTVAVPSRYGLAFLPLLLAERNGFGGQAVHLQFHDSGQAAAQAVLQGRADVLAGGFEHLFEFQLRGESVQAFAQMTQSPMIALGVASRGARMQSWLDMRGARVGVSALQSGTHWLAAQWLMRQGVLPTQVQFVEVGSGENALGAIWEGHVDALCGSDPLMHWLEVRHDVRLVAEARTQSGTRQLFGGPIPGACLMAREEVLSRAEGGMQGLTESVLHALQWLQTAGPTDLFRNITPPAWLPDRAVILSALEKLRAAYSADVRIAPEAVQTAWRAHARLTGRDGALTRMQLGRLYTNSLAERAGRARLARLGPSAPG